MVSLYHRAALNHCGRGLTLLSGAHVPGVCLPGATDVHERSAHQKVWNWSARVLALSGMPRSLETPKSNWTDLKAPRLQA